MLDTILENRLLLQNVNDPNIVLVVAFAFPWAALSICRALTCCARRHSKEMSELLCRGKRLKIMIFQKNLPMKTSVCNLSRGLTHNFCKRCTSFHFFRPLKSNATVHLKHSFHATGDLFTSLHLKKQEQRKRNKTLGISKRLE